MTKYARLKKMKDNFIRAATNAKNNFMIQLWINRAEKTQEQINKLTINEAMEEC